MAPSRPMSTNREKRKENMEPCKENYKEIVHEYV